jgi:hypothetical protein
MGLRNRSGDIRYRRVSAAPALFSASGCLRNAEREFDRQLLLDTAKRATVDHEGRGLICLLRATLPVASHLFESPNH